MRVAFARESFGEGLAWSQLAAHLPGWTFEISSASRPFVDLAADVDVVCAFGARIDRSTIAACRFGLIQQFGVGVDGVDLDAASEHGVWVARLPGNLTGNADAVAELAIHHALSLLRRVDQARDGLRHGKWSQVVGRSLEGATVVVVGMGNVGHALVERLHVFGARVVIVRAHPELGAPVCVSRVFGSADLIEAVRGAQVVIACATLDAVSRNQFDADVLSEMEPGSYFVNVGRGPLVDEDALVAALDDGPLGGAAVDVYSDEPIRASHPLLNHPKVICTPHIGAMTRTVFERSLQLFAHNLRRWAEGRPPDWALNSPATTRRRRY